MLYDLNQVTIETVRRGEMPFIEYGAEPLLKKTIGKTLFCSSEIELVGQARFLIISIGTPVDEYLNPKLRSMLDLFTKLRPYQSITNRQSSSAVQFIHAHVTRSIICWKKMAAALGILPIARSGLPRDTPSENLKTAAINIRDY